MEDQWQEDDADPRWRVGAEHIKLEDLMLVGLQHIAMDSWQAHLRLMRCASESDGPVGETTRAYL